MADSIDYGEVVDSLKNYRAKIDRVIGDLEVLICDGIVYSSRKPASRTEPKEGAQPGADRMGSG